MRGFPLALVISLAFWGVLFAVLPWKLVVTLAFGGAAVLLLACSVPWERVARWRSL